MVGKAGRQDPEAAGRIMSKVREDGEELVMGQAAVSSSEMFAILDPDQHEFPAVGGKIPSQRTSKESTVEPSDVTLWESCQRLDSSECR